MAKPKKGAKPKGGAGKPKKGGKKGAKKPKKGAKKARKTQIRSASPSRLFGSRLKAAELPPLHTCAPAGRFGKKPLYRIVPLEGRRLQQAEAREVAKFQHERAAKAKAEAKKAADRAAREAAAQARRLAKAGVTKANVSAYEASLRANPYKGI